MSQDEFSGRRNSVKRSGKRFTVDMRKELETLIVDCYGNDDDNDANEDGDDVTSPTTSTNESPMDADTPINTISATIVGSTSPVQQEKTTTPPPSKQFKEITQPQDTATSPPSASPSLPTSSPTTSTSPSPRKLVYSRSQSKISVSNLRVDGNGRSSNPIPVDANYGSGTSDSEKQSGDSQATESVQTGDKPELSRRAQTLDLKVEVASSSSDKKQTSKSAPTSPTPTSNESKGGRHSLFFDSAATRVSRAVIITTNTATGPQGPFTVYVMEVYSEGGQVIQNVSKRFKNFSDLVEKLKDRAPEISSMLPHKVLLGNMAAKLVSHRKEQLQALLDYILGHKELSRSVDVLAFFRNPTLLKQLASKPDMEGYLNKGVHGTLGVKFIQMWTSLRSPCLYFWQSQSETAELKSAVVLRWLTVDAADEPTFTIELRPWQYLLFPSDTQSRPIIIRAGSREEMIGWVRALHAAKAAVNDIIMLKKTMLQEEDATSELDLGDDEEDIVSPRLAAVDLLPSVKIPPLSLSVSSDAVMTKSSTNIQTPSTGLPDPTAISLRQNTPPSPAPASPRTNADSHHRNRIQTQPPNLQAPPKMTPRSNTEGHLALPRKNLESPSLSAPTSSSPLPTSSPSSPSPTSSSSSSAPLLARNSIAAKLKDFAEKTGSQPLSRFETRMALLQAPPKYPPPSPGKMVARKPENNPLLLTSHIPTPDTEENILLSSTKQQYIRGATANKLFEKIIDHTFTGTEYLDLVSAFLIGYRTFATPTELLDRLIQAFHASGPAASLRKSNSNTSDGSTTRLCICNFLSKWVDFHLHDFLADANLVNKLITFLDSNMQANVPHNERTAVEKVKTTIKKKTRDVPVTSDESFPPSILPPLFSAICAGGINFPFMVMDFDKTEVARHLCGLEFEAFAKILPTECLGQAWNKKNKETNAPHITAIIKRFNEVSCWVSSMLVTTEELKARTAVLARFIEIADECRQSNNFNSVVAIVSGLESSAVHRLKKTWAGLPPQVMETFEQLKSLMTTEKNYLTYRNVVKLANPPCIPYLGVFLTDLVFIDEAPDVLQPSGLINFDKWYKVAWVVREIRKFQVTKYPFRSSPEVLRTLLHLPALPENEIYSLSLKCEERTKT